MKAEYTPGPYLSLWGFCTLLKGTSALKVPIITPLSTFTSSFFRAKRIFVLNQVFYVFISLLFKLNNSFIFFLIRLSENRG